MSNPDRESGGKGRALGEPTETKLWGDRANKPLTSVRRFRLMVVEGPKAGLSYESTRDHCSIGSHPLNDLVIEDPTVSRFHCDVRVSAEGPVDLKTPFLQARDRRVAGFERRYLDTLLRAYKRKVGETAAAAGIDRVFLWRLRRRHGLRNPAK
jgi:FHA domain-containing protein